MMRQWLGWKYALLIIGLAVLALLVIDFNNRMAGLRRLSEQQGVVAGEATALRETQAHLQTEIAYATSEAAVMEWAYAEGHRVREGDLLVVPVQPPEGAPEPTATALPTPTPESNWQIWLSLFIDREPQGTAPVNPK